MNVEMHVNGGLEGEIQNVSEELLKGMKTTRFIYWKGEEYEVEKMVFDVDKEIYIAWLGIDESA